MSEGNPEKPVKKTVKVDEKQQFADHQEYCVLKLNYENLKKEAQKKYSKKERMLELEKVVEKFNGPYGKFKKDQGLSKMSIKGEIVYLTQDLPNPKKLVDKFNKEQQAQYFK